MAAAVCSREALNDCAFNLNKTDRGLEYRHEKNYRGI